MLSTYLNVYVPGNFVKLGVIFSIVLQTRWIMTMFCGPSSV